MLKLEKGRRHHQGKAGEEHPFRRKSNTKAEVGRTLTCSEATQGQVWLEARSQ